MIREHVINVKQNLIDTCLQVYGTTNLLYKLAKDNGLQIDAVIGLGDVLVFDDSLGDFLVKNRIARRTMKMVNPSDEYIPSPLQGIGVMIIENTFIIG